MKRVTVKDISERLHLSLGTINKALNNKPGINSETRKRIIDAAKEMGYKVNKVAQSMARNTFKIGVIVPTSWPEFYNGIKAGIYEELDVLSDYNVECTFYDVKGIHVNDSWIAALEKCKQEVQAVILCPPQNKGLEDTICDLVSGGIFVMTLESDMPGSKRQLCVQANHTCIGQIAAEISSYLLKPDKVAAVFVGNKDMENHQIRAESFLEAAKQYGFSVSRIYETHDDPEIARFLTDKILSEYDNIGVIFSATGNYKSVCESIVQAGNKHTYVIGMDIYAHTSQYMEQSVIKCIIDQSREEQGKKAIRLAYARCMELKEVPDTVYIVPKIILNSNLGEYAKF